MATMDDNAVFIDTNILVYSTQDDSPFYEAADSRLAELHRENVTFWISRQILREFLAIRSRPQGFVQPLSPDELVSKIHEFSHAFRIAEDSAAVTAELLDLIQKVEVGGKQIHDANIVATMRVYGIPRLLTHNVRDFARFAAFITILPLQETEPI